ncbi:MAG: acyl-CoA dehydrogenase, partial [Phycisphaerae bacterium]|nr:acyl-CoA dehydrogenase [Phycisphaerae bacterium]
MNAAISDDHRVLIEGVRDYARGELLPRDRQWDHTEASCCEMLPQLSEMGLLGLRVPEADGGLACPMVPYAHIIRELSYASPAVGVMISVHSMVCEIIKMYAASQVRSRLLRQLASPGNLAAFAISEADAGSDPASARTRAERVEGGWRLNGSKMWVTNGITGRWFVVLARTGEGRSSKHLSMFLLDTQQPGISRTKIHGKMGIRGSETAEMGLDNVFIPGDALLGDPGDGLKIALSALDGGRIGIASQAIGIAQACLDEMVSYSKQRKQFDQPIANFQAIQWMIADSATELTAAQLLTDQAAALKESGQPFTSEASMAKLFASEAANRIAYRAVQVHGGS